MRALITLLSVGLASAAFGQTPVDDRTPPAPPPAPAAPAPKLQPPELLRFVEAAYPLDALEARAEAQVVLGLSLTATGALARAVVLSSSITFERPSQSSTTALSLGFIRSATTAAARLVFAPARLGEQPVPINIRYRYDFNLPAPPALTAATSSASAPAARVGQAQIAGVVRASGARARMAAVSVVAEQGEDRREVFTDEDGNFAFDALPKGDWRLSATLFGYRPFRTIEQLGLLDQLEVTYYIEPLQRSRYEVVVTGKRRNKEVTRRTLDVSEIVRVPGTLGDPIQAVENLPGVARPPAGLGVIIVRGSAPEDTGVFIEGIQVPNIYHFGGLRSVLPGDMLSGLDFYPGNFGASYGRQTGGILDARLKRLDPDQVHGSFDVSLLDAGLYVEVPIGDNAAIAFAGRRSYIDVILNAVIPDDSAVALVAAPRYYDYQLLGEWRPAKGHELRLFFFGSDDELSLLLDEPAELDAQINTGAIETTSGFNRVIGSYTARSGKLENKFSLAYGQDTFTANIFEQFRFDFKLDIFHLRDELTYRVSDDVRLTAGVDALLWIVLGEVRAPRPPQPGDAGFNPDIDDVLTTSFDVTWPFIAPYVEAEWTIGDLTLIPSLRMDWFQQTEDAVLDPRLVARLNLGESLLAKGGVGLVHQAPQPFETDNVFGNPELGPERALHTSIGAEYKPLPHVKIDATLFYKRLDKLVSNSSKLVERGGETVREVFANTGTGNIYGFELYLRHEMTDNLRGWLSYTLSRSERTDDGETRIFAFDQTHILSLVGSYVFPDNWEAGVRWRLVSGYPYTPFNSAVFTSDFDRYVPVPGPLNSERLAAFHQLDLRIEKRWLYDVWMLAAYLSLSNAYNRSNPEGEAFNYDYSESQVVSGLPIYPILGIRGEL